MPEKMQTVRLHEVPVALADLAAGTARDALASRVAERLSATLPDDAITVVRRSLDARQRPPCYVHTVDVTVAERLARRLVDSGRASWPKVLPRWRWRLTQTPDGPPPVVVGAGPAGLFAALTLAEGGWPPLIIEQGKPVPARSRDVSKLYARGQLNPSSNVCYGEGGAGTYSDGKLYTRVGDPRVQRVLEMLVARGAKESILVDNRPHLGTDKLVGLLRAIRAHLQQLGAAFRFETAVADFELRGDRLDALKLAGGERLEVGPVVLATGHSARFIWRRLQSLGVGMEARPLAMGFRVEHPQALINALRYGDAANHQGLPAADYRLTFNQKAGGRRGVWSFCMCPGGVVVTTPTRPEELCINGMSHAARSGRYANSALVVTVNLEDFAGDAATDPFAGVQFQAGIERAAYQAGGGQFVAPAARLGDFMAGRLSRDLGSTSYRRGLVPADLSRLYPASMTEALRQAVQRFERKMPGFITNEAKLIGVETRTASPIRVRRDTSLQAEGAAGLYPAGEGMGYGGGIVSAAVDGTRVAEAILERAGAYRET